MRPGLLAWARRPSPRGVGELAFRCAPFPSAASRGSPPQGCRPIRWCGNSGFRLVPSYHNGAQGLGLQGKRTAPGGRFQKTVGFRFAFSQEGEIQLEDPAGNYRLCDFTAGAFPDRAVLTVYWDLHRKTGMKAGPVHVDRACFHASMLMALTGRPSWASWAASSWPSGMPPWASPSSPMWNTSGQVPATGRARCSSHLLLRSYWSLLLFQNISIPAQCHHLPGNELAALPQGRLPPPAAYRRKGDIHPHDGQLPDIVAAKDLRQLFGIVSSSSLGRPDQRDAAPHEPLVEVRPGISRAVRRDQRPGHR